MNLTQLLVRTFDTCAASTKRDIDTNHKCNSCYNRHETWDFLKASAATIGSEVVGVEKTHRSGVSYAILVPRRNTDQVFRTFCSFHGSKSLGTTRGPYTSLISERRWNSTTDVPEKTSRRAPTQDYLANFSELHADIYRTSIILHAYYTIERRESNQRQEK